MLLLGAEPLELEDMQCERTGKYDGQSQYAKVLPRRQMHNSGPVPRAWHPLSGLLPQDWRYEVFGRGVCRTSAVCRCTPSPLPNGGRCARRCCVHPQTWNCCRSCHVSLNDFTVQDAVCPAYQCKPGARMGWVPASSSLHPKPFAPYEPAGICTRSADQEMVEVC